MKMYRESFRKLMPIGIPLAVATLLYTMITNGQNCFGASTIKQAVSPIGLTPVLVYYVFTAVIFAFYGFSYLFKRSASDLYHSIPVSRMDLYLSVTLATATWMGGTILLNVLVTLALYLIGGCPFVPLYIPLIAAFYFVASMLVYAAAAIGCSLSGTYITALATTGIVLFLPRFLQFIIARGIIAKVTIIGWMDVGAWLNPMSNIATGLVVMQSRNMFVSQLVSLSNILYSLIPMVLELALAAWLFLHRPSETADRGATGKVWTVTMGVLLSFTLLLLITVGNNSLVSVYSASVAAIALLVYVLYQYISLRSIKQTLKVLPYYLLSLVLVYCVSLGINAQVNNALGFTPAPGEIASVSFRGHDMVQGADDFASIALRKIKFDNDDLKSYVADNLSSAVEQVKADLNGDYSYSSYNSNSPYSVIEPVVIKMKSGKTVYRTFTFANADTLNQLRSENDAFTAAIRQLPAGNNIQYLNSYFGFTKDQNREIWDSYASEMTSNNQVSNDYYRTHAVAMDPNGLTIVRGGDQPLFNMSVSGYVGTERFSDNLVIRLNTPQTAALVMRLSNARAKSAAMTKLKESITHITSPFVLENDNVSITLNGFNMALDEGDKATLNTGLYLSGNKTDAGAYADTAANCAKKLSELLIRGTPTDDVNGMFLGLEWSEYDSGNMITTDYPMMFLSFSAEDQATLTKLLSDWNTYTITGINSDI